MKGNFYVDSKYEIVNQMRYDKSKVVNKTVRFLGVLAKNELYPQVFVNFV